VNFAAITLYVASQRVFIVVSLYFVIDSVRKLLDTPSYWAHDIKMVVRVGKELKWPRGGSNDGLL
jgi:hypothetical protein